MSVSTASGQSITIRQATPADVDVIVLHRCNMFADMGHGDKATRSHGDCRSAVHSGRSHGWFLPGLAMLSIAQKLGAVAVLQKPFVADELLMAVGKALGTEPRPS